MPLYRDSISWIRKRASFGSLFFQLCIIFGIIGSQFLWSFIWLDEESQTERLDVVGELIIFRIFNGPVVWIDEIVEGRWDIVELKDTLSVESCWSLSDITTSWIGLWASNSEAIDSWLPDDSFVLRSKSVLTQGLWGFIELEMERPGYCFYWTIY